MSVDRPDGGQLIFVDELTRFAYQSADQRVIRVAERVAAPLRVSVRGRRGVGCSTVARALELAGVAVAETDVDLQVYVVAEVVKPEDAGVGAALAVLNKADLAGFAADGSLAPVEARFSELVGAPILPMSGLLALAALDGVDGGWGALAAGVAVEASVVRQLRQPLGPFGIALALAALRQGADPAQVLRRASGIDAVVDGIARAGAPVRYRRVLDAVVELEALAVADGAVAAFLASDDAVVARMDAALEVTRADGLEPGPDAPLSRAVHWQRRAPSSDLHRACGADIVRGSLRLWSRGLR